MLKNTFSLLFVFVFVFGTFSQISVTNTLTPQQLVQNILLGTGVTATNIKYNGSLVNAGIVQTNATYFNNNGTPFPINNGVLLTSGAGVGAMGPNDQSAATDPTGTSTITDVDMSAITPNTVTNGVFLEFDFLATGDSVSFQYLFGSEEYPDDYGSSFYDVFGFFLSGPGFAGPYSNGGVNIATLPGTTTPISILNLNPNTNIMYYVDNDAGLAYGNSIQYDGTSIVFSAGAQLICGQTYHIKIGISNVGDQALDSGVFLKGGSFSADAIDVQATNISGEPIDSLFLAEGCNSAEIHFIRPLTYIDSVQVFHIQTSGDLDGNTDLLLFADSVIFNVGVDTVSLIINPIDDGIVEPMETMQLMVYNVTQCGDTIYDSLNIYIVDEYILTYSLPDTITTQCLNVNPDIAVTNLQNSVGPYTFSWSNSDINDTTTFLNTGVNFDSTYINVIVTDGCGTTFPDSVLIINDYVASEFMISPNDTLYNSCPLNILTATAILDSLDFGPYTYDWSTDSTTASSNVMNVGIDGSDTTYYVTTTNICGMSTIDSVVVINHFVGPVVFLSPNDTIYTNCLLDSTLSVVMDTLGVAPYTYLWSNGSTNDSTYIQVPPGFSGQYVPFFVTITDACGNDTTLNGVLEILPDYVLTYDLIDEITTNCSDINPVVSVTNLQNSISPYSYSWSNSTDTNPTTFINTGINFDSTYFHVIVTDGCGNIFPDSVLIINDYEVSTFLMTPNDTLYNSCPSNILSATVILNGIDHGPYTYDWNTDSTTATSNVTNPGVDGSQILYTVITTNICGMSTINSVVVINDFLEPIAFLTPNDTLYTDCLFDSALCVVNGLSGTPPYTYLWSNGSTNDSTYIHDLLGINNQTSTFQVTLTDACGNTQTKIGKLIVQKTLNATLTQDPSTCIPDGNAYSNYVGETGTPTFQWIGPGNINADTTYLQNNLNISSGWYYYTITDDVCSDSDSIFVDQIPGPIAKINAAPLEAVAPASIVFSNTSENATNYFWNFGNGLTTTSSNLTAQTSLYNESGTYIIELIAVNGACSDTAFVTVKLIDKPFIIITPNVFSPNGDGENDLFFITTKNVESLELIITNRWGNIVYEETSANPKWNGSDANEGVYFYTYKATGFNGEILDGQGFLHLVKD